MTEEKSTKEYGVKAWIPLIVGLSIGLGVIIGTHLRGPSVDDKRMAVDSNASKFERLLNYVDKYYVDSVNVDQLTQKAIDHILEDLDPHTVYVPPAEADIMASRLDDGFEGVGIEFRVIDDTLKVVSLMPSYNFV